MTANAARVARVMGFMTEFCQCPAESVQRPRRLQPDPGWNGFKRMRNRKTFTAFLRIASALIVSFSPDMKPAHETRPLRKAIATI